jgi:Uma2 family endonuclease
MATEPKTRYTYDDLASFPDDHLRREIIDGELVVTAAPTTRHQRAVLQIGAALLEYSKAHGGEAYVAPTDVFFANDSVVEPDVLFVGEPDRKKVEVKLVRGAPDVVVEVSSPSTIRVDLVRKLELYQRFGVPEYWFVDLEADRIEIHRLAEGRYGVPELLRRGDMLTSEQLPEFEIAVDDILGAPDDEPVDSGATA